MQVFFALETEADYDEEGHLATEKSGVMFSEILFLVSVVFLLRSIPNLGDCHASD